MILRTFFCRFEAKKFHFASLNPIEQEAKLFSSPRCSVFLLSGADKAVVMTCNLQINFLNDQTIYCPGQTISGEDTKLIFTSGCNDFSPFSAPARTGNVTIEITEKSSFCGEQNFYVLRDD